MSGTNRIFLEGRLVANPDFRFTNSGVSVAHFTLAHNRSWKDKTTDEWREDPTFIEVTAWARKADKVNELLSKGDRVFVEGELRMQEWENSEGEKRRKLKIHMITFSPVATPARVSNDGDNSDDGETRPF